MNSDNLGYVLREFAERPLPSRRPRELALPTDSGKVVGLAGLRRTGKTFLFFDTIAGLVARGVDRRRIVYLSFEDDRLQPISPGQFDLILRGVREVFPGAPTGRLYIFLDEVQNAPGWERWVRRVADTEDASIFVTGSSSRVLTRDLASALRGRSVTFEVFPLSFREFLAFRGIEAVPHSARSDSQVRSALEQYLTWGGFPEVATAEAAMRPLILEEYASVMLLRDLVERHAIRNEPLMRALLRHCYRNTASFLSLSKLHRDFTSLGFLVSKNTLFDYMAMLEEAGLVFLLPKHERSLRKQAHNPKKLHVADTGLVSAFKAGTGLDAGHRLETAVFLECRRRQRAWHYHSNGGDIDLCDAEGRTFFNSCWSLTEADAVSRERRNMESAATRLPAASGRLLYHEYAPELLATVPGAQPAWRWLLEPDGGP